MNFTTTPDILKPILRNLALGINNKTLVPALENILVTVSKKLVTFTTTDLGITVTAQLETDTHGKGCFLLPFKQFTKLIALETEPVHVELTDDETINISFGADPKTPIDRFCLGKTLNFKEFPTPPTVTENPMPVGADFITSLNMASMGVSKDNANMQNVCVELTADKINVVSTDGFTLYLHQIKANLPQIKERIELLLPPTVAQALSGLNAAQISFSKTHIAILSPGLTVCCGRGNNNYVGYRKIMPIHNTNITLSLPQLADALSKAMVVADINHGGVDFFPSAFDVAIRATDKDTGMAANCILQADIKEVNCTQLRVNGRLCIRSLKQIAGLLPDVDKIDLSLQTATKPITIHLQSETSELTILVMPMNIN